MPERQAWLDGCEAEEESSGGVVVVGSCRGGGRGRGWKRMECVLRKKGEGVMEKDETTREKLGAQNYNLGKMVCEGGTRREGHCRWGVGEEGVETVCTRDGG